MDLELAGKTALVTGASKGIGRAAAEAFAREGCNLRLAARSKDQLEDVRDGIVRECGVKVEIFPMDLSAPQIGRAHV